MNIILLLFTLFNIYYKMEIRVEFPDSHFAKRCPHTYIYMFVRCLYEWISLYVYVIVQNFLSE